MSFWSLLKRSRSNYSTDSGESLPSKPPISESLPPVSPATTSNVTIPHRPSPLPLQPPSIPPLHPHYSDFREELHQFQKLAEHLLRRISHLYSANQSSFDLFGTEFASRPPSSPFPSDTDPTHLHHLHRIRHHLSLLLPHLSAESSNLIAAAEMRHACSCHGEATALALRLRKLQSDLWAWCSGAFGEKRKVSATVKVESVGMAGRVTQRFLEKMSVGRAAEMVIWGVVESVWLGNGVWFPVGLDEMEKEAMREVEGKIRVVAGNANAEIWRACTASLLARVGEKVREGEVERVGKVVETVVKMVTGRGLPYFWRSGLKGLLLMALDVAMEMRCMKAFYELDEGVEVGEGIGGRRMEIIDGEGDSEEECGELVVVAIMSKGMVERRWRGEGGNGDTVIKARVLLGKQEDMQS